MYKTVAVNHFTLPNNLQYLTLSTLTKQIYFKIKNTSIQMYKYCTKFCKINILNVFLLNLHDEIKNLPTLVMQKINLSSKIISLAVQT